MITISNLSKQYGSKQVLKDINIHFEQRKVYGIVGENGAGKTTLFRCIAGLENCSGTITSTHHPLKNHLGLLFAEPFFFSKITGREYIQLLCNARKINIKHIDEKNIFDLPLEQYASTYSTGMKKKLAITAILLQENKYLVFDEPFNGVDIHGNIIISAIIRQLKELGKTVLLSSHIFSTLSDSCDEIHLLKDGQFTEFALKEDFPMLEKKMNNITIGQKLEKLELK